MPRITVPEVEPCHLSSNAAGSVRAPYGWRVKPATTEPDAPTTSTLLPLVPLDVRQIPLAQLRVEENVRPSLPGLDELAASFAAQGQLQPGLAQQLPDEDGEPCYRLIFGHRRLAAARQLDWETLRCEVRDVDAERTVPQQLVENLQRHALSPVAEARAYVALQNSQEPPLTNAAVARLVGCDPSHVSHRLTMLRNIAPPPVPEATAEARTEAVEGLVETDELATRSATGVETSATGTETAAADTATAPATEQFSVARAVPILDLVDRGEMSASVAEEIARLDDYEEQQKAARNVLRQGWGVERTARHVREVRAEKEAQAQANAEAASEGDNGSSPMTRWLQPEAVTAMPRLAVRPDLAPEDLRRANVYALLRNGMDRELLDYLAEERSTPYEGLGGYVLALSDEQVEQLLHRLITRYLGAAHRYPSLEPEVRVFFGEGETVVGASVSDAVPEREEDEASDDE